MNEEVTEEKIHISIQNVNKDKYHVVKRWLIGKSSFSEYIRDQIDELYERIIKEEAAKN